MKIKIPDTGMDETAHTIIDGRIIFVRIAHDENCQNPMKDDGMGQIRQLGNRDDDDTITHDEFLRVVGPIDDEEQRDLMRRILDGEEIEPSDPDAVILSKYEHSLVRWFVRGGPGPQCRWDTTQIAGVWTPDDVLIEEVKGLPANERRAKMVEYAQQACDVYTDWCNGNCYGFEVFIFTYIPDCDDLDDYETPLEDECCWGFIGDSVRDEARATAESLLKHLTSKQLRVA